MGVGDAPEPEELAVGPHLASGGTKLGADGGRGKPVCLRASECASSRSAVRCFHGGTPGCFFGAMAVEQAVGANFYIQLHTVGKKHSAIRLVQSFSLTMMNV